MVCKHIITKKLDKYGEEECLKCGVSLDTSDPNMLNEDGSPTKQAQNNWTIIKDLEEECLDSANTIIHYVQENERLKKVIKTLIRQSHKESIRGKK